MIPPTSALNSMMLMTSSEAHDTVQREHFKVTLSLSCCLRTNSGYLAQRERLDCCMTAVLRRRPNLAEQEKAMSWIFFCRQVWLILIDIVYLNCGFISVNATGTFIVSQMVRGISPMVAIRVSIRSTRRETEQCPGCLPQVSHLGLAYPISFPRQHLSGQKSPHIFWTAHR